MDNLMLGVQLTDVSTRCSSHPQGISEARCENAGAWMLRLRASAARCRGRSASANVISVGAVAGSSSSSSINVSNSYFENNTAGRYGGVWCGSREFPGMSLNDLISVCTTSLTRQQSSWAVE